MSNSRDKYENKDYIYWDNLEPMKRINNTLTSLQAINIINRLSLYVKDENSMLLEEVEVLKEWIKSK